MSKLTWNSDGSRYFGAGLDRGVLYVDGVGVPWNGLVSVQERPKNSEPRIIWLDGVKVLNVVEYEDFDASLSAFYSPVEFDQCDGYLQMTDGVSIGQQSRKPFDLSYRTKIGNDISGQEHGYKIHLIYNAMAEPSDREHKTIDDNVDPSLISWSVTTTKRSVTRGLTTAYMVIDSTKVSTESLTELEGILYGTDSTAPRIPRPFEVAAIVQSYYDIVVEDNGDGTFTVFGKDSQVIVNGSQFTIISSNAVFLNPTTYTLKSDL